MSASAVGLVVAAVAVASFGLVAAQTGAREARRDAESALELRRDAEAVAGAARLRAAVDASRDRGELGLLGVPVEIATVSIDPTAAVLTAPDERVAALRAAAHRLREEGHADAAAGRLRQATETAAAPGRDIFLARYDLARSAPTGQDAVTLIDDLAAGAYPDVPVRERLAALVRLGADERVTRVFHAAAAAVGDAPTLATADVLAWRLPSGADEIRVALAPWPAVATELLPGLADGTFRLVVRSDVEAHPLPEPFTQAAWAPSRAALSAIGESARDRALFLAAPAVVIGLSFLVAAVLLVRHERASAELRRRRDDFLCAVTHELKTPVANVLLYAETLREHGADDPASVPRFAGVVAGEALRLDTHIQDLLDVAAGRRVPAGVGAGATVDVVLLLRELADEFAPRFEAADMSLDVSRAGTGVLVYGSPALLRRALRAVLENALRFAGAGAVRIDVTRAEGGVQIRVLDDGPGIAPADRERIFEPFERLPGARRGAVPGTGLGLALARRSVEACGGTLVCAEARGAGAEFVFDLPSAPRAEGGR